MPVVEGGTNCNLVTGYSILGNVDISYGKKTHLCQTFTIDSTHVLWRFRLMSWTIHGDEFYHYDLYATDGAGKPTGAPLASTTLSPSGEYYYSPGKWRRFDFSPMTTFAPGVYALVVSVPTAVQTFVYKLRAYEGGDVYPHGKAWRSTDAGLTWAEIINTDFFFEVWGWEPPPEPPPDPAVSNWAPLDMSETQIETGYTIVVTTDIPVHLFMRWSITEPLKHPATRFVRGISLMAGVRYCFVAFHENEQEEPGDTFVHTFIKPDWPVCTTRWFYFIGTKQAEETPSSSPIFSLHRKSLPWGWYMDTFNSIEPQLITSGTPNIWTERDASKYVHPDATGIILQLINRDPGANHYAGIRAKGSTLAHTAFMSMGSQTWAISGLDSDKLFEIFQGNPGWQDFWVMGYTGRNVHFFTDPLDFLPAAPNVYHDCDIYSLAPQAVAALFSMGAATTTSRLTSIRKKGSTDDRYWPTFHIWPIIGLDANGKCQVKVSHILDTQCQVWCIGYIDSDIVTETNGRLTPLIPLATWTSVPLNSLLPNPRYAVVEMHQNLGTRNWGVQKNQSLRKPLYLNYFKEWIYTHLDNDSMAQFYKQDASVNFYVIAEVP